MHELHQFKQGLTKNELAVFSTRVEPEPARQKTRKQVCKDSGLTIRQVSYLEKTIVFKLVSYLSLSSN